MICSSSRAKAGYGGFLEALAIAIIGADDRLRVLSEADGRAIRLLDVAKGSTEIAACNSGMELVSKEAF